jgi:transposase
VALTIGLYFSTVAGTAVRLRTHHRASCDDSPKALQIAAKHKLTRKGNVWFVPSQDFAVDSSSFSTGQFVRWLDVKNSTKEDRRHWLKLHLMVGTKTNVVTSVEVSDGFEHDYHRFKPLVDHTAKQGFQLREVSADKGYLGVDNLMTTLRHGAIPYIPFKTNSVAQSGWEPKSQLWTRMYHFYSLNRAEFLQHYHKRSNVETTFHMIKNKFGQRLHSRTLTAQVNEALCKVLCHNLCVVIQSMHELNITPEFSTSRHKETKATKGLSSLRRFRYSLGLPWR